MQDIRDIRDIRDIWDTSKRMEKQGEKGRAWKSKGKKAEHGDEEKGSTAARNCCDAVCCCYRMDSALGNAAQPMMMIVDFLCKTPSCLFIMRSSNRGFQIT